MIPQWRFKEIAESQGVNVEDAVKAAESKASPQPRKIWGLRDTQCDVVVWLQDNEYSPAVVNWAIGHYRGLNEG